MLEVGWFSTKLLLKGKLLRNPEYFAKKTAIGVGVGSLLLVSLAQFDIPFWFPVVVSSLVTGAIMPFLLKDIRMK
jgi:hypothetical protein